MDDLSRSEHMRVRYFSMIKRDYFVKSAAVFNLINKPDN